jgi:alpha/beta superfamily hydrolase
MEPFYFGPSQRRLFGAYHPPPPETDRDVGVVLCYPAGQEYIRSHQAFLQLALRLSAAGFHTLRFDFSGCGDSAGSFEQARLADWKEDAVTALCELQEGSAAAQTCLIGLRLGASLATLVAAEQGGLEGLVIWDGATQGSAYLSDIRAQHKQWSQRSFSQAHPPKSVAPLSALELVHEEIIGFPLSAPLLSDLEGLDLLRLGQQPAQRVLLLDTQREGSSLPLATHLRSLDTGPEHRFVEAPSVWKRQSGERGDSTVPAAVLDVIVEWMCRSFP